MEKATFAAGCFWGVEAAFRKVSGVVSTACGYIGGRTRNPTYEEVCTDETGHAEAVELVYDPAKVSYEALLAVFWDIHDPTTVDRQGDDEGSQYRSAVFFHAPAQRAAAEASKAALEASGRYPDKIVTQVLPVPEFFRAEEYHQNYFEKKGVSACGLRKK